MCGNIKAFSYKSDGMEIKWLGIEFYCISFSRIRKMFSDLLIKTDTRRKQANLPWEPIPVPDFDNGIIGWGSQNDNTMPLNFPKSRKWIIVTLLSLITFISPFTSSILALGIRFMNEEFGEDDLTVGSLPVSIFLLGYAIVPLLLAPLSEIYSRYIVLTVSNAFFMI